MYKHISLSFKATLLSAVLFPAVAYADLPFEIVPDGTLPTEVSIGSPVSAAYEVSNNTRYARSDNFVLSLPPNVVLDPSVGNGDCGTTFDLAAKGSSGDSCILNLLVYGAVNGSDPNPSNHLFVCMSDRTTCSGTAYPLNVTISDNPPPPPTHQVGIAVGMYIDEPNISLPLIYSQDSGDNWDLASSLSSVMGKTVILRGTTCVDEACTTVGVYSSGLDEGIHPLIFNSTTEGATWIMVDESDITLPEDAEDSLKVQLNSVVCQEAGSACTTVGFYLDDESNDKLALILISSDGGDTWSAEDVTITLPAEATASSDVELNSVTCADDSCIAAGFYLDDESTDKLALILMSSDGGETWTGQNITITLPSTAADSTDTELNSVTCTADTCTTVGFYNDGESSVSPMVLNSSTDDLTSWSGQNSSDEDITITLPTAAADSILTVFTSVTCSADTCTAVGVYNDGESSVSPMVLNSSTTDLTNWSAAGVTITLPTDAQDSNAVLLASVACTATDCTATGTYANSDKEVNLPLVLNSSIDDLTSWSAENVTITLPENTGLSAYSATCLGELCIAAGQSFQSMRSRATNYPLILDSTDDITNADWQAVPQDDITLPDMPEGVSVGASAIACESDDLCFITGIYMMNVFDSVFTAPFILIGDETGVSWSAEDVTITLPSAAEDSDDVQILGVSCADTACTAIGFYTVGNDPFIFKELLLLNSNDSGETWSGEDITITLPSDYIALFGSGFINTFGAGVSVECLSTHCIAAATYQSNTERLAVPWILISNSARTSWSAADVTITLSEAAENNERLGLSAVDCVGNACTATGYYQPPKGEMGSARQPLILNSTDGGRSWTGVQAEDIDLPSSMNGWLNDVDCTNGANACTAVGAYQQEGFGAVSYPLILNENSDGSWTGEDIQINLPEEDVKAALTSITCSASLCTATGGYNFQQNLGTGLPLILNSTVQGTTWNSVALNNMELPDNFTSGVLLGNE